MATITADKVLAIAQEEVGYLEKASPSQLDSKTANAGKKNYTKYGRDMGNNGVEWCGQFVSWCFKQAYGDTIAKQLLCGGYHAYTPTGAQYFKNKGRYKKRGTYTPKPGDVIFFYSSTKGRIGHVGIVTKTSSGKVYTIEGNTSGANTLITNGGGVRAKSYALTSTYIDGYGDVAYDGAASSGTTSTTGKVTVALDTLKSGSEGAQVRTVQRLLLAMGYKLPKYGADGDFGSETLGAVKAFQKAKGLEVDGIVGTDTWSALLKDEGTKKTGGKIMIELDMLKSGSEGAQVKTVQRLLMALGYKLPKYGADGDFGSETISAVKSFQKAKGLSADGIVGADTWGALLK